MLVLSLGLIKEFVPLSPGGGPLRNRRGKSVLVRVRYRGENLELATALSAYINANRKQPAMQKPYSKQ